MRAPSARAAPITRTAHRNAPAPHRRQTSNATNATVALGKTIWHRGRPNLAADFDYLTTALGLGAAVDVIFTGGSAGGASVFYSLDFVRGLLPSSTRLFGAPDAGFFVDAPVYTNASQFAFREEFIGANAFWNSTGAGSLNARCLAAFAAEPWRCFFPNYYAPYVETPWHAMMAAYDLASLSMIYNLPCLPPKCAAAELQALRQWRGIYLRALAPAVASFPFNGAYADSCLVHEQNVMYCQNQPVPNCRGWNTYNVTAAGFPAQLTPQAGFSLWFDALSANWEGVVAQRRAWAARVDEGTASGGGYPQRRREEEAAGGAQQVLVVDPVEWPNNPSCPWGT